MHPTQEKMGKLLFDMIKKDRLHLLKDIKYFDFYVISPQFRNLGELKGSLLFFIDYHFSRNIFPGLQTVERLKSFIESNKSTEFLNDIQPDISSSQVEEHVIRNAAKGDHKDARKGSEADKMNNLRRRILHEKETFFFIVHDEAHYAPVKHNMTDRLINSEEIISARNVVLLQVSATPYCLLTKNTRFKKFTCSNVVMKIFLGFPEKTLWTWPSRCKEPAESPLITELANLSRGQSFRMNQHREILFKNGQRQS